MSGGYTLAPPMRATPAIAMTASVGARANVDAAYPVVTELAPEGFTATIVSVGAGDSYDRGRIWKVSARL